MKKYTVPEGLRVYAVGDVHGHHLHLAEMQARIMRDFEASAAERAHIVYLGDYVDRGPDSRAVIENLIAEQAKDDGIGRTFLCGNHEKSVLRFLNDPLENDQWFMWGGLETVRSYGVQEVGDLEAASAELAAKMPAAHLEFIKTLPTSHSIGDYFFAHAGVDPTKSFEEQSDRALMWIRLPFFEWDEPLDKKVVHGHTISKEPVVRLNRIGVDTGLFMGRALTAAVLQDDQVEFLQVEYDFETGG